MVGFSCFTLGKGLPGWVFSLVYVRKGASQGVVLAWFMSQTVPPRGVVLGLFYTKRWVWEEEEGYPPYHPGTLPACKMALIPALFTHV